MILVENSQKKNSKPYYKIVISEMFVLQPKSHSPMLHAKDCSKQLETFQEHYYMVNLLKIWLAPKNKSMKHYPLLCMLLEQEYILPC